MNEVGCFQDSSKSGERGTIAWYVSFMHLSEVMGIWLMNHDNYYLTRSVGWLLVLVGWLLVYDHSPIHAQHSNGKVGNQHIFQIPTWTSWKLYEQLSSYPLSKETGVPAMLLPGYNPSQNFQGKEYSVEVGFHSTHNVPIYGRPFRLRFYCYIDTTWDYL